MKALLKVVAGSAMVLLSVCVEAQPRFAARLETLNNPALSPDVATVSGLSFSVGHMKIDMASGKAAYVMAGSDKIGIFFRGNGSYRYQVGATELPTATNAVRKASNEKIENSTISGTFTEVLLLSRIAPLPALTGSGAGSITEDFAKHRGLFARNRDAAPSHRYLLHELSFPTKTFVLAEFSGGSSETVYAYDEGDTGRETLQSLRSLDTTDSTAKRWIFGVTLSDQPIGRDHRTVKPAPYTLTAVDFTLIADGDDAKLNVKETIQRGAGQNVLRFSLNDIVIPKAGATPRHYNVDSITDAQGKAVPFEHRNDSLVVGLEGITGDTVTLDFRISGDFLVRPNSDNFWQLGIEPWFPQPDLGGQYYTVHSIVKVKKPYIAFAPGKTIGRREEGEYNVVENVLENPSQFAVVHAGKYTIHEETREGLTMRVASYAGGNERAAKQLTNLAFSFVDYYQHILGPFPFPEVNIIQVNTFGYGQAPPGTVFITNEAFNSMVGEANQFFSQGINERFAHEIAHFYWGHVIKMPNIEEQWLTESFAEYSAALALKNYQGKAVYDRMVAFWKRNANESTKAAPIAYANRLQGDPMIVSQNRAGLLYNKGAYLLYTLHQELGDEKFLTFMKSYQKSRRWRFSNTAETAGLLQFLTKKDYMPFFDKYYWGTEMPK